MNQSDDKECYFCGKRVNHNEPDYSDMYPDSQTGYQSEAYSCGGENCHP